MQIPLHTGLRETICTYLILLRRYITLLNTTKAVLARFRACSLGTLEGVTLSTGGDFQPISDEESGSLQCHLNFTTNRIVVADKVATKRNGFFKDIIEQFRLFASFTSDGAGIRVLRNHRGAAAA
jgi:hypothetical protein